jgi:hypothetical protein
MATLGLYKIYFFIFPLLKENIINQMGAEQILRGGKTRWVKFIGGDF